MQQNLTVSPTASLDPPTSSRAHRVPVGALPAAATPPAAGSPRVAALQALTAVQSQASHGPQQFPQPHAIPMDDPCCSCKPTRVPQRRATADSAGRAAVAAAGRAEAALRAVQTQIQVQQHQTGAAGVAGAREELGEGVGGEEEGVLHAAAAAAGEANAAAAVSAS